MKFIGLFFFIVVLGMSNFAEAQEWVPFDGEIPENAVMPTDENRHAGAICRMNGPQQVSPIHLLGSVQKVDGEFVCRGATYSGRRYRPARGKVIISDPEFQVLVIADVQPEAAECPEVEVRYETMTGTRVQPRSASMTGGEEAIEEAKNHEFTSHPGCWGELLKPIQQQKCLGWYTDEEREAGVECLQSYRCGPGTGLTCD